MRSLLQDREEVELLKAIPDRAALPRFDHATPGGARPPFGTAGAAPVWRAAPPRLLVVMLLSLLSLAAAQSWQRAHDDTFTVLTASPADERYLPQVFEVLQRAGRELRDGWGFELPVEVTVVIHPNLHSFTETTAAPWYLSGLADRAAHRLDVQRLRVLFERMSFEKTLRHELFHLAQPETWPRWRAEGSAMIFAGELPRAQPLAHLDEAQLDALLVSPSSREELARAAATAYLWVMRFGR